MSVHPHVRGDYRHPLKCLEGFRGSPPRAWGLLHTQDYVDSPLRFTPTCVGTTREAEHISKGSPVHPHVRGDYNPSIRCKFPSLGSPPTCVGTTWGCSITWSAISVHPHVRGDYCGISSPRASALGSPPRAWGLRRQSTAPAPSARFTPTCVGTTPIPIKGYGASRFTPTCVGTTRSPLACPPPSPVHPHVRGDYDQLSAPRPPPAGSPPRAWGLHQ